MGIWKGSTETFSQDTSQALFQYYLQQELKTDITLTSPVEVDDEVINVSAGHGFTNPVDAEDADQMITIVEGDRFEQAYVINVTADAVKMSIPSGGAFSTEAKVIRGNKKLNLDGSSTPIEAAFRFHDQAKSFVPIDLSYVVMTMAHSAVGDDGKFGGIAALDNGGFYFRRINADRTNMGNYRNNQAFKDFGAFVKYPDKGPSGTNSTEIVFDLKHIFGQVVRLNPRHDDKVVGVNRNNLTGLTNFYISLIGSFTAGE
jgi:hypothetical protein